MLFFVLLAITVTCTLLGILGGISSLLEKRVQAPAPKSTAARKPEPALALVLPNRLPDRDAVCRVYALSDRLPDHFYRVVHS